MNPELKAYLDDWQARQKRVFDDHLARMDAHLRSMQDITGCVTGPVQASSGTSELVTASAGLSEPPAPAPSIVASPVVAPAAHIDTIAMVPASCSTECATQAITASTTPTLLPWVSVSSSSPATSTTNSVVSTELATDIDDGKHDASLNDNSVNAVPLSVAPALSLTAGARDDSTPSHMSPTRCSTYGSTTDAVVSLQLIQVRVPEALVVTSASSATTDDVSEVVHDAHSGIIRSMPLAMEEALLSDQVLQPLWPPTPRDMNQCNSSKPRPIPWPSFEDLPGGVHLTEPRPQLEGTLEVAAAMRGFDQEEQFTYLCANLNMLENFLKKPGAEWEAAIWSDLTSRAPRAFKLWCIPWVSLLFLDLRPPWPPPLQINFCGLCSFAQLDTEDTLPMFPWNPRPAMRSSSAVLYDEWVVPSWDSGRQADASYDKFPCAVRNAYEPGYFVMGGLAFPDLPSSRAPPGAKPRKSAHVNYLMRYCGAELHLLEGVREISILLHLQPWYSEKVTCLDNPNLTAQECLIATPGVKKISTSLTTTGSLQLHFIVFSGNSKSWSYCWFPGCTYEAYNCWGEQCYGGAATSVLPEFIGTSNCYLHFGTVQNLRILVCCAWAIIRLLSCWHHCLGYFWMTWDPGWRSNCIIIFCCCA